MFNNQYAVQKKLSSGSFGVVFQGEDKLSGEPVALKIEKNSEEEGRSLEREVNASLFKEGLKYCSDSKTS